MTNQTETDLSSVLEAILFAAERPLSLIELSEVIRTVEEVTIEPESIQALLEGVRAKLEAEGRGFDLVPVAGGWEFRTRATYADYVHVLFKRKPQRLHRAGLEVLAIIAYRQPVTRPEIDDIRGVDSSNTLRQLLERNLIRILGKSDEVGRPLIYGTTPDFLSFFGMQALSELPTLREFTELTEEHMVKLQALDQTLGANQQTSLPLDPNGLAGISLGDVPAGERTALPQELEPTADDPNEGGDHLTEEPRG